MSRPPAVLFAKLLDDVPFTDEQLGRAIGRSTATVFRWRHGHTAPSWDDMQKVADVVDAKLVRLQARLSRIREACETYHRATLLAASLDGGYDGQD